MMVSFGTFIFSQLVPFSLLDLFSHNFFSVVAAYSWAREAEERYCKTDS